MDRGRLEMIAGRTEVREAIVGSPYPTPLCERHDNVVPDASLQTNCSKTVVERRAAEVADNDTHSVEVGCEITWRGRRVWTKMVSAG